MLGSLGDPCQRHQAGAAICGFRLFPYCPLGHPIPSNCPRGLLWRSSILSDKSYTSRIAFLDYMASVFGPLSKADLARSAGTVAQFAGEINISTDLLIEQLEIAGIRGLGPSDQITLGNQQNLLEALKARNRGEKKRSEVLYERKIIAPDHRILVEAVNDELLAFLAKNPLSMYELTSRKFEELVARIFSDHGFDVELTQASRDGGYDILATLHNPATSLIALVECKKYSPENRVGVEIVRGLYGVTEMKGANQGLVVTSSFFTRGAVEEKARIGSRMELRDYNALTSWLGRYIGNAE